MSTIKEPQSKKTRAFAGNRSSCKLCPQLALQNCALRWVLGWIPGMERRRGASARQVWGHHGREECTPYS
eukprot:3992335-Amphidinium_carterae.3